MNVFVYAVVQVILVVGALAAALTWYLMTHFMSPPQPVVSGYGTSFCNLFLERTISSFIGTWQKNNEPYINYVNENVDDFVRIQRGSGTNFVAFDDPKQAQNNNGLVIFPMTGVSIIPIVHFKEPFPPGLPKFFVLTPENIVGLYNGTITHFCNINTFNPEWNPVVCDKEREAGHTNVTAYHRVMPSGTNYIFTSALASFSPEWASAYPPGINTTWYGTQSHIIDSNAEMMSGVAFRPFSIGYVPYPDYVNSPYATNNLPVRIVKRDSDMHSSKSNVISGEDPASFKAAAEYSLQHPSNPLDSNTWWHQSLIDLPCSQCWPFSGWSYIAMKQDYVAKSGFKSDEIYTSQEFFKYAVSDHGGANPKNYHVLSPHLRTKALQKIASIKFNGNAVKKMGSLRPERIVAALVGVCAFIAAVIRMVVPLCRPPVRVLRDGRLSTSLIADADEYNSTTHSLMRQILENDSSIVSTRPPRGDDTLRRALIDTGELVMQQPIGKGASGDVFIGTYMEAIVAIKRIMLPANSERMAVVETFVKEASMMASMRHPNIVQFLGASVNAPYLYLITEYCSQGSLYDVLHGTKTGKKSLTLKSQKCAALIDAALGIKYLHGKGIVHRDIKTHNLLVDRTGTVKVADFGTSTTLGFNFRASGAENSMKTMVGTPEYVAPEVVMPKGHGYSYKADVYSFGIVAWEVWTGKQPYHDLALIDIIFGVTTNGLRPPIEEIDDPKLASLIEHCWDQEPDQRPSFEEILSQLRDINDEDSE